jgi:hypothetical protein
MVDAWRAFHRGDPAVCGYLAAARHLMDAPQCDHPVPEAVPCVDRPELDLLSCLLDRPAAFQESLVQALLGHKRFWSRSPDARRNYWGFLALGPLALAAAAYDRGIPFEVESDYLPMPLVRGDYFKR